MVILNGRFAGRKAIVVKTFDEGHSDRKFGHAIGIYTYIFIMKKGDGCCSGWCGSIPT